MPIFPEPTGPIPRPALDMYRKFMAALTRLITAEVTGTQPKQEDVDIVNGQPGGRNSEHYLTESVKEELAVTEREWEHTREVVEGEGEGVQ